MKKWYLLLKQLIKSFFKKKTKIEPYLPAGVRIYCIGDIHGCNQLLIDLIKKIKIDSIGFSGQIMIIYLGDYIDRGNHSKEVIETLISTPIAENIEHIYLRGNHEQTLLDFIQEDSVGRAWFSFGGLATLVSYNVSIGKIPTKKADFKAIQQQLIEKLPDAHHQFLTKTTLSYSLGAYYFVHAGIYPGKSLAKQNPEDMLWIRDDFIASEKIHEKIIVHGHTVTDTPELLNNRIGIDTGAYASGVLTCLVLEENQQRILQT